MLRGMSQRLSDGECNWEADKRGLEGQLNRTLHSLRESQATADQLRSACQRALQCASPGSACNSFIAYMQLVSPLCSLPTLVQHLPC